MIIESPWFTTSEACTWGRFEHRDKTPNLNALYEFLNKRRDTIRQGRQGRKVLINKEDFKAAIERAQRAVAS